MEDKDILEVLVELLRKHTGACRIEAVILAAGGSSRRYYRLSTEVGTYIGTYVPDPIEGECFVRLARDFRKAGREVPEVYASTDDFRMYIQEDLGDRSLFSALASPEADELIKDSIKKLVALQKTPEDRWKDDCMSGPFSRRQILWDLNYFKYEYLRPKETVFDEERLEDDFECLADSLLGIPDEFQGFMMRDCQSRNIMVTSRGPVFIDFQGGRKGPALYDAVSFLWQARAGFSHEMRMRMLDYFCDEYCYGDSRKKSEMLAHLSDIVLFRTLQVLGAYGFRGLVQKKSHFLLSIPGALENLRQLLDEGALEVYPELKRCVLSLTAGALSGEESSISTTLTVEIYSFSYKKGYPEDLSGNGGGFMFDCRALHNPGRYPEYRSLTGRDKAVIDFLEARGEIQPFLRNAWALTDPAIERYASRGFTHLLIGFGCTGGQHRSVYCAEHTAAHIKALFPEISVRLIHREHP